MGLAAGQIATADDLKPRGILYQGNRNSNRATAGALVEVPVMRLDSMVLKAGRCYKMYTSNIKASTTVAGDHWRAYLKYNGTTTATISDTEIGHAEASNVNTGTPTAESGGPIIGYVTPTVDSVGSLLLSIQRITISGAGVITILSETTGIWMTVEDIGLAVPDNGIDL